MLDGRLRRGENMKATVFITIASLSDLDDLIRTEKDAFSDDERTYGTGPYGSNPEKELTREINECQCYKITVTDKTIGGAFIRNNGDGEYRLKRIWIQEKDQGKGLGTGILKRIENMLIDKKKLSLDTPYKSYRNHHFYEKNGFIKAFERKLDNNQEVVDPDFTLFEYEKRY